jgi:hypothetical protein
MEALMLQISKPQVDTPAYFNMMKTAIEYIQEKLPMQVFGMTGYELAFYWKDTNGDCFPYPQRIPLAMLEVVLKVRFTVEGDGTCRIIPWEWERYWVK